MLKSLFSIPESVPSCGNCHILLSNICLKEFTISEFLLKLYEFVTLTIIITFFKNTFGHKLVIEPEPWLFHKT